MARNQPDPFKGFPSYLGTRKTGGNGKFVAAAIGVVILNILWIALVLAMIVGAVVIGINLAS